MAASLAIVAERRHWEPWPMAERVPAEQALPKLAAMLESAGEDRSFEGRDQTCSR